MPRLRPLKRKVKAIFTKSGSTKTVSLEENVERTSQIEWEEMFFLKSESFDELVECGQCGVILRCNKTFGGHIFHFTLVVLWVISVAECANSLPRRSSSVFISGACGWSVHSGAQSTM